MGARRVNGAFWIFRVGGLLRALRRQRLNGGSEERERGAQSSSVETTESRGGGPQQRGIRIASEGRMREHLRSPGEEKVKNNKGTLSPRLVPIVSQEGFPPDCDAPSVEE